MSIKTNKFLRYVLIANYSKKERKFKDYFCCTYETKTDSQMIRNFLNSKKRNLELKIYDHKDDRNFYIFEITKGVMFVTGATKGVKFGKRRTLQLHQVLKEYYFRDPNEPPSRSKLRKKIKKLVEERDAITESFKKIDNIKQQMIKNIDSMMENTTKLEVLGLDAFELETTAKKFKKKSKWLKVGRIAIIGGAIGTVIGGAAGIVTAGAAVPVGAALGAGAATTIAAAIGVGAAATVGGGAAGALIGGGAPSIVGGLRTITRREIFGGSLSKVDDKEEEEEEEEEEEYYKDTFDEYSDSDSDGY